MADDPTAAIDAVAKAMSSVETAMQEADEALRQAEAAVVSAAVRTSKAPDAVEPGGQSE